jgi:hypothetical protein
LVAFCAREKAFHAEESFVKAVKYGLVFPFAALFPLPVACRTAQIWSRLEARWNPGLVEAVQLNAARVLASSVSTAALNKLGEKFFCGHEL